MSDYKVFNDNGEERSWEELYEDNVALTKENEKLNHYKLLYQKVKARNDKAIEYIKEQGCYEEDTKVFCDDLNYYAIPKLLEILKEEQ